MRIQMSLELLTSMVLALAIALSLSMLAARGSAIFAQTSNTIASASGSIYEDYKSLLSLSARTETVGR